jgi:hypothetical protein
MGQIRFAARLVAESTGLGMHGRIDLVQVVADEVQELLKLGLRSRTELVRTP